MKNILELLTSGDIQGSKKILTYLGQEAFGAKALLADGRIIYDTSDGLFEKYDNDIRQINHSAFICPKDAEIFCDVIENDMKIVICGAGHVSMPVIRLGRMLGAEVTVIEDREYFAKKAEAEGASKVICEPFEAGLDLIDGSGDTYFILLTRGHAFDRLCLEKISKKERAYTGMLGSRKRMALVREALSQKGIDGDFIDSIYTPIGLDINAESPVEIAIAIMGQIIQVRKQRRNGGGFSKEMIKELLDPAIKEKAVATIVKREGSAPRGPGTKMIVFPDRITGTIGGGYTEAMAAAEARRMMREKEVPQIKLLTSDITLTQTKNGAINGGSLVVMIETVC